MRYAILLAAALCTTSALTQTITSVQDGNWVDPATWDCNCVPNLENVEILHTVQFTTNMKLIMQQIHVAAGAAITMDAPHLVVMLEEVVNDGSMMLAGSVDVDGELFNNGVIHIEGDFFSHGLLAMGGWGTLLTAENMEMGGTINGQGHICVSGITWNYGSIQGEVDICDTSPTTSTPPFLDNNTGTVGPTVTYCEGQVCSVDLPERADLDELEIWPVPANEQLTAEGLPPSFSCTLEVRDPVGRIIPVHSLRSGTRMIMDVAALPAGMYTLMFSTPRTTRCVKVVVGR